ncbi:MAG: hypothetical protein D6815_02965 [Candidatus Dadabacteria bacterium]|nr:MAG: hypothetical protein D6815_02965 [Candidatus Dadabacteria bacterium]
MLTIGVTAPASAFNERFVVVVNPNNPVSAISRDDLERIYRRTLVFWPNGRRIVPINAPFGSPLREAFRKAVLRSKAETLATYWNRRYFDGILPPPVLKSVEAIRAYVARRAGAIAYLPPEAVDDTVKPIAIVDRQDR